MRSLSWVGGARGVDIMIFLNYDSKVVCGKPRNERLISIKSEEA